jgi:hypothetical protein
MEIIIVHLIAPQRRWEEINKEETPLISTSLLESFIINHHVLDVVLLLVYII